MKTNQKFPKLESDTNSVLNPRLDCVCVCGGL